MIRPEWQGVGLGGALQQRMMEYAKARGLRGFTANILAHNAKMRRLFQEGPNVTVELADGVFEVRMLF
jgi:L-amino acid N-acyltransferase YncA